MDEKQILIDIVTFITKNRFPRTVFIRNLIPFPLEKCMFIFLLELYFYNIFFK